MNKIILSENLHPVIQGEGELIGKKMILMRVHGCPVQCPSCDSFHTWDESRLSNTIKEYEIDELANELLSELERNKCNIVLITGGEPQLYKNELAELIEIIQLEDDSIYFDIETTGATSWPDSIRFNPQVHFDLSPKIGSLQPGANIKEWKLFKNKPDWFNVKIVTSKTTWKEDKKVIKEFQEKYNISDEEIYLMPMGTTRDEMILESAFVLEKAMKHGFQFSPRLHIFIYDSKRLV